MSADANVDGAIEAPGEGKPSSPALGMPVVTPRKLSLLRLKEMMGSSDTMPDGSQESYLRGVSVDDSLYHEALSRSRSRMMTIVPQFVLASLAFSRFLRMRQLPARINALLPHACCRAQSQYRDGEPKKQRTLDLYFTKARCHQRRVQLRLGGFTLKYKQFTLSFRSLGTDALLREIACFFCWVGWGREKGFAAKSRSSAKRKEDSDRSAWDNNTPEGILFLDCRRLVTRADRHLPITKSETVERKEIPWIVIFRIVLFSQS
ncbi:hypothetical protein KC319_g12 [Hortaea werneckii]|nr:hypothetical protein KC319_g12 [Hortaea werneckii]